MLFRFGFVTGLLCMAFGLFAQNTNTLPLPKSCSQLREILYRVDSTHFMHLTERLERSSSGEMKGGGWRFATEKYTCREGWFWPGATETFIEYGKDERQTGTTQTWQYIARFPLVSQLAAGEAQLDALVKQMNDCWLPINDSVFVQLRPEAPDSLPANMPDNLLKAFTFHHPASDAKQGHIQLMAGLEFTRKAYRSVFIVEWLEATPAAN